MGQRREHVGLGTHHPGVRLRAPVDRLGVSPLALQAAAIGRIGGQAQLGQLGVGKRSLGGDLIAPLAQLHMPELGLLRR